MVQPSETALLRLGRCLDSNNFRVKCLGCELTFQDDAAHRMLRSLKMADHSIEPVDLALPGWCGLQILIIDVIRSRLDEQPGAPAQYVLRIHIKDAANVRPAFPLEQTLGLSASEAALAFALAKGLSLDDYANLKGLSKNTVRTQASVIRRKTGARSQLQIACLVWLLGMEKAPPEQGNGQILVSDLRVSAPGL